MLALYIIWKYLDIKNGNKPEHPVTIIFGGKAAPAIPSLRTSST